MFDQYVLGRSQHHSHNHRVEVTEHRAPTDESLKLLREMEQKVEKDRIASMVLDSNGVKGRIEFMARVDRCEIGAVAIVDLNGERIRVESGVGMGASPEDLLLKLRDDLAKEIASRIMIPAIDSKAIMLAFRNRLP